MAIPLTLKLDAVPEGQLTMFVRHALDSPWVESRMDVLAAAVSVVDGHFLPIVCEAPILVTQKWPTPFTRRPVSRHLIILWTSCAVRRKADILGQA